jgi:hypothetical protein
MYFLPTTLFLLVSFSWLTAAPAAIIYVDKDKPCPGSGTSTNPHCSIQKAFDKVIAGDTVRIRDSVTPYDENAVLRTSGAQNNPIIIEADIGHNPTLRYTGYGNQHAPIEIFDADHVTVRNLKFNGFGTQTSTFAVLAFANSRNMTGITINGNRFENWGGTGNNTLNASAVGLRPSYNGGYNNFRVTALVSGNTFANNAGTDIRIVKNSDTVIRLNTSTGLKCGLNSTGYREAQSIKDSQGSSRTLIEKNIIQNFEGSAACTITPTAKFHIYVGIYCDTGPTNGIVRENEVYNIDSNGSASGSNSVGIFIESKCSNWTVHGNIVRGIGQYGIRNGSITTGNPDNTIITHNTVSGIAQRNALIVFRGNTLTIKNNIFVTGSEANSAIEFAPSASLIGHVIDYNLYWDMKNGTKIGRWGDYTTRDIGKWRTSCNCDARSLSAHPMFMSLISGSEDCRLSPLSPARGAGERGVDIGAYQSAGVPVAPGFLSLVP